MNKNEKEIEMNNIDVNETLEELTEDLEYDKNEHFIGNLSKPAKVAIIFVFGLLCFTAGVVFGHIIL